MPIDKRQPRVLNSDADSKTLNKVSMEDALNLYSGPDNEGILADGSKSDSGDLILKNIRGNKLISSEDFPSNARLIGSVEDAKTDITYLFVYSANGDNQGIWAYDRYGKLPGSAPNTIKLVYKSSQFNFPQNGFIKADIVRTNAVATLFDSLEGEPYQSDFDKDVIIYFTDGKNEPRKINAYRAFNSSGQLINGSNVFSEADFITACPKTPLKPITFTFDSDPGGEPRSANNFERSPGFQFAYQHIYTDGMESAISSYSDIAVLYSVLDQGSKTYVPHPHYRCLLSIPSAGPEISKIRILGRQGNYGGFLVIDEIESSLEDQDYPFFNDRVLRGVSTDEVNKQFDSVPRKAESQAVSSNRLMYANYLDGFNESGTTATAQVRYLERPQDFIDLDLLLIPSSYGQNSSEGAAFFIDYSQFPNFLPAETEVSIRLSFMPDRNFHVYNPKGAGQSRQRGPQPITGSEGSYEGVNFEQSIASSSEQNGSLNFVPQDSINSALDVGVNGSIWGQDFQLMSPSGVSNPSARWQRYHNPNINGFPYGGSFPAEVQPASFGLSATSPFIFQGGEIEFSVKIKTTIDVADAPSAIKSLIDIVFVTPGLPLGGSFSNAPGFILLEYQNESSYSFDLNLQSGDTISQYHVGQGGNEGPHANSDKIIAVHGGLATSETGIPVGCFIVNKATPTFTLSALDVESDFGLDQNLVSHFGFNLRGFDDVETLTCMRETPTSVFENIDTKWILIDADDLDQLYTNFNGIGGGPDNPTDSWLSQQGYGNDYVTNFKGFGNTPGSTNNSGNQLQPPEPFRSYNGYGNQVGRVALLEGDSLINLNQNLIIVDGEGGPGGGPANSSDSENPYDKLKMYNQGSVTAAPWVGAVGNQGNLLYNYLATAFYGGVISPLARFMFQGEYTFEYNATDLLGGQLVIPSSTLPRNATTLPFLKNNLNPTPGTRFDYLLPDGTDGEFSPLEQDSVDFSRNQTIVELFEKEVTISLGGGIGLSHESFKTEANHDFGIVYYDERGRHGFVNHLDSAFVEGYSDQERGSNKGRVEIDLHLSGQPPSWAHSYKIVYAKNSTVQDFVQYSVGGAFVIEDPEDNVDTNQTNKNIYVSLNYLQGHPISYVSSFGARTPEGGLNFYKFEEGDKLLVISHGPGGSRVYDNYDFEVVGTVNLGGVDNPLSTDPTPSQQGEFVILKNNPDAEGFSFTSVLAGSASNKWNKNCVVELRTPKKVQDADNQVYYEVSDHYRVLRNPQNGILEHEEEIVTVDKGDVWFRPVATNVRELEEGEYVDIILDDDGNAAAPQPNFTNVFLETVSQSDLFRSDSYSYISRPNFIFKDAKETTREATITYSEPSNPEGKKVNYSSFNASLANFKDLPEGFGGIQYTNDHNDYLFVLQEDKVSIILVNKNIISSASGTGTITASSNVLGEAVFYPGRNGVSKDPSSIFDSSEEVYFCNKSLSKVYRWSKQKGVEEISGKGMSSIIRASIKRAISNNEQIRIVGGYDPLKDEYLLTILNPETRTTTGAVVVDQESTKPVTPGGDDGDTEEDGEAVGGSFPVAEIEPESLNFGLIDLESDTTSITREVIITNSASPLSISLPLEIVSVSFENPLTPVFKILSQPELPIEPGQQASIVVEASPEKSGVFSNSLVIRTNEAAEKSSNNIPLSLEAYITPIDPEEFMNAQEAIDYLISLKDAPESDHPTFEQMSTLMSEASHPHFRANLNFGFPGGGPLEGILPGKVSSSDLLLFLESFNFSYETSGSFFSDSSSNIELAAPMLNEEGGDVPEISGGLPVPALGVNFNSAADAINALLTRGDMTAAQFHFLNTFINKKVSHDFDGNGVVGTNDLLDLLQTYEITTILATDPAFTSLNPLDLTNQPGPLEGDSSSQILSWIVLDGSMTASEYWYLSSFVKKEVKCDVNGDGIVGSADHLSLLNEWTIVQEDNTFTPYNGSDPAFS